MKGKTQFKLCAKSTFRLWRFSRRKCSPVIVWLDRFAFFPFFSFPVFLLFFFFCVCVCVSPSSVWTTDLLFFFFIFRATARPCFGHCGTTPSYQTLRKKKREGELRHFSLYQLAFFLCALFPISLSFGTLPS